MNKHYGKSMKELREQGIPTYKGNYRSTYKDNKWKKEVHKRDNDICQCCGKDNLDMRFAHHLYSFVDNEELRYNIDNGITMCKECHIGFHKKYGNGNNTKEQYEEFKKGLKAD